MFIAMKILIYSSCRKPWKKGDLSVFSPCFQAEAWGASKVDLTEFFLVRLAQYKQLLQLCQICRLNPQGLQGLHLSERNSKDVSDSSDFSNSGSVDSSKKGGRSCPLEASATRNIGFSILEYCLNCVEPGESMFFFKAS